MEKKYIWHRIKMGQTLSRIAKRNGIESWKELYDFNKDLLKNPNLLIYIDEKEYDDGWCINNKQGILRIPIADHLNSQAQPEEKQTIKDIQKRHKEWKEWKIKHEQEVLEQLRRFQYKPQENHMPATPDSWGREILKLDRRKQDTPEEWEDRIGEMVERFDFPESGRKWLDREYVTSVKDTLIAFIDELLEEREREVITAFLNDTVSYNSFHKGKPRVMRNGLSGEGFEVRVSKLKQ
jgi:hypothetical protein